MSNSDKNIIPFRRPSVTLPAVQVESLGDDDTEDLVALPRFRFWLLYEYVALIVCKDKAREAEGLELLKKLDRIYAEDCEDAMSYGFNVSRKLLDRLQEEAGGLMLYMVQKVCEQFNENYDALP